ncbi:uncharacterized protein [Garra rufa]|uniref:uncharacterized protein n=1 Tax=Garra rufa TaxID=137080 RepID=UPI003CCE9716
MKEGGRVHSENDGATESLDKPHPITGTSDRFSLYDRFHQRNQKQEKEKLRSLDLVPELTGLINSSMAEQLNRELANSRYFLCQLKDVHFMFALRLVFHLHNTQINRSFMDKMVRQTQGSAEVGPDGRLCLFTAYRGTHSTLQNPECIKGKKKELISEEGQRFSTSLFPILKENKNLKTSDTVVFPRCVSRKENPEIGDHFIMWVLCGQSHELRVFDSMGLYKDIPKQHMEILCHAFSNTWNLADWTISYPPQWLQSQMDVNNCGVFVCTMAEMELKGYTLTKESIGLSQTQYLREYHATVLVKDVVVEDSMKNPEKPMQCMAGDLRVCCFQKVGEGPLYPSVVKILWVQCDLCLGWLHTDCAGVKEAEAKKGTFKCGCGCDLTQPYAFDSTQKALRLGIENIISDEDIQALHKAFHSEALKSCRFYMWKHPETSMKFKQHLKPQQCHFSQSDVRSESFTFYLLYILSYITTRPIPYPKLFNILMFNI